MNIIASELSKHRDECPKEIIKCPQKCGSKFERCKLNEHKDKCPFTLIKCPFEKIGCKEVLMRNDFHKRMHDNMPKHLNLILNEYLNFKEKSKNLWKQHGIEIEEEKENENKEHQEKKRKITK
jgi:glycine cleavage system regulatory protein